MNGSKHCESHRLAIMCSGREDLGNFQRLIILRLVI